jgi:hypothetical protein
MRKIIALILFTVMTLSSLCLVSCSDEKDEFPPYEFKDKYEFDPYDTRFKEGVIPSDKDISVKGKTFIFDKCAVREGDITLDVTSLQALEKLYTSVLIVFTEEDEVEFVDYSNFFDIDKQKVDRRGNVIQFENTNKTGTITYTVRIEIYEDSIWVVHNAHHFYEEGKYAMIRFVDADLIEESTEE